jgi:hypothetical protein
MANFVQIGDRAINLDRVTSVRFNVPHVTLERVEQWAEVRFDSKTEPVQIPEQDVPELEAALQKSRAKGGTR